MANKIQIRRGLKSAMPTGSSGEPLFATDTRELFVGTGSGNVNMGGSHWYRGTAMSGTSSTANAYSYSACPQVKLNDLYLNTSNGNVYACTTAGSGSSAKWTYQGCIKGATGATGNDGKSRNGATLVIGSSASGYTANDVDYLYTGSNGTTVLQNAINALPSSGGKIVILEGTYNLTSALTISKNVVIEGTGDGTALNVSDALATGSATQITFRDMKITANTISKYLYKGNGSDNVVVDNCTVDMIATGSHSLGTTDAEAAFLNSKTFTANKSRMSLKAASGSTLCYAIVELANISISGDTVNISDCHISLNGQYGRIHIARYYVSLNNCNINAVNRNSVDTINCCVLSGLGVTINGGYIYMNSCNIETLRCVDGAFIGVRIYSDEYHSLNIPGRFIGCLYHNVELSSESTQCQAY